MLKDAVMQIKTAGILLILLITLTGVFYPLTVTLLAQLFFPWQANGSLIEKQGEKIGSLHIGQDFFTSYYFWGRPSVTLPFPYNGEASSGSNKGPSNLSFLATVKERVNNIKKMDKGNNQLIPVDLVTASASGLDPEISPAAAFYQVARIAKARQIPEKEIQTLIQQQLKQRTFYILGEPRINVLQLNLAMDNLKW